MCICMYTSCFLACREKVQTKQKGYITNLNIQAESRTRVLSLEGLHPNRWTTWTSIQIFPKIMIIVNVGDVGLSHRGEGGVNRSKHSLSEFCTHKCIYAQVFCTQLCLVVLLEHTV